MNTANLKVTVRRSEWGRGTPNGSRLFNDKTGKLCCLGFAAEDAGVTRAAITDKGYPYELGDLLPPSLKLLVRDDGNGRGPYGLNSPVGRVLTQINDTEVGALVYINSYQVKLKDEAHREELITKHGLEAGIEFTFVD